MKNLTLMSIVAGAAMLLAGCSGGSPDSSMSVSTPPAGTTPVVPVVPSPSPGPSPGPSPAPETPTTTPMAPDFTDYLSKLVVSAESEEPAATDDIDFVFADDEDDAVFATLLLEM